MLAPFFLLAGRSPTRQATLRRAVVAHLLLVGCAVLVVSLMGAQDGVPVLGHILLVAGIVEGGALIGWRLTQLPRSQALEFLLVSPVRPRPLFLAEALVGLALFGLVTLSGLPVLLLLVAAGVLGPFDPLPLLLMPFTWGALTGLGLAAWAYEPKKIRRWAERVLFALIVLYLVVGVLAGENLKHWVECLPEMARVAFLQSFTALHTHNPFGTLRFWLEQDMSLAWPQVVFLEVGALLALGLLLWRAACRLQGHFHERHYEPVRDVSGEKRPPVGNAPLTWWAVKRVTEYAGRGNLYLAGGFCSLYAIYIVAGERWPAWLGVRVFQICDTVGGVPGIATALTVLAAVPAAFQYGLWDSNDHDRCRRLELLLLTQLRPGDYWNAAASAAWKRGRGYFASACLLWAAALLGGRLSLAGVLCGVAAGVLLWSLYFALGFRAFARGSDASGAGGLLTLGLPALAYGVARAGWPLCAAWLPPGMVCAAAGQPSPAWLVGPVLAAGLTLFLARHSLAHCDAQLRRWYDQHHGARVVN